MVLPLGQPESLAMRLDSRDGLVRQAHTHNRDDDRATTA